jgi:hypothetical protein
MRWRVVLCGVLWISILGVNGAAAFDPSRYRPLLLRDVVRQYPAQRGLSLSPDIPIRLSVVYSGEFRDLQEDSRRLIRAWSESMSAADITDEFKREVKVCEAGVDYWLPVQQILVPIMTRELRPGGEIQLFVIYVGQVDGRHLFLVNAFDHKDAPSATAMTPRRQRARETSTILISRVHLDADV